MSTGTKARVALGGGEWTLMANNNELVVVGACVCRCEHGRWQARLGARVRLTSWVYNAETPDRMTSTGHPCGAPRTVRHWEATDLSTMVCLSLSFLPLDLSLQSARSDDLNALYDQLHDNLHWLSLHVLASRITTSHHT